MAMREDVRARRRRRREDEGDGDYHVAAAYGSITKVQIYPAVLNKVIQQLRRQELNTGEDDDTFKYLTQEERVIGRAPNATAFTRWSENNRQVKCDFIGKQIIVREVPGLKHGSGVQEICYLLSSQRGHSGQYIYGVNTAVSIGNRVNQVDVVQPDVQIMVPGQSLLPGGNLVPDGYPAVVVEVATSQRPVDLHGRAGLYLGNGYPTIQMYIGIQAYNRRVNSDGLEAFHAAVYFRLVPPIPVNPIVLPTDRVSFGTDRLHGNSWWSHNPVGAPAIRGVGYGGLACNAFGMADYTIQIPSATIFASRVGGVPANAPQHILLDLFAVAEALRRSPGKY